MLTAITRLRAPGGTFVTYCCPRIKKNSDRLNFRGTCVIILMHHDKHNGQQGSKLSVGCCVTYFCPIAKNTERLNFYTNLYFYSRVPIFPTRNLFSPLK